MPRWPNALRMINPFALLFRFWKQIVLIIFLAIAALAGLLYLTIYLPFRTSYLHERHYLNHIEEHESRESQWEHLPDLRNTTLMIPPSPWNERPHRLIQDMIQLSTDGWRGSMSLHNDGTGLYPSQDYWIYFGGTAPNASEPEPSYKQFWREASIFPLPGPSCGDPPEICDAFNQAYDTLMEKAHGASRSAPFPLRRFVDCDHSPLLCGWLTVNPVMLIHVSTEKCQTQAKKLFNWKCEMKWTFVGLPLAELPFQKTQKLADGRVVPVFPSAEEQLASLILHDGSLKALQNSSNPPTVEHFRVSPQWRDGKDGGTFDAYLNDEDETGFAGHFLIYDLASWFLGSSTYD